MHVRVKRGTTTWFVACDASSTVQALLVSLEPLTGTTADDMQLVPLDAATSTQAAGPVLLQGDTLAGRAVGDSAALGLQLRAQGGAFEPLHVAATPSLQGAESA
jgi:hypothetical protein